MEMIAWSKVYRPLAMGGLGLISISEMASMAITRQAWHVASKQKTIWLDWMSKKYIKGIRFGTLRTHPTALGGGRGFYQLEIIFFLSFITLLAMAMILSFGSTLGCPVVFLSLGSELFMIWEEVRL